MRSKNNPRQIPNLQSFVPQLEFNIGYASQIHFIPTRDLPQEHGLMLQNAADDEFIMRTKELEKEKKLKEFKEKTRLRAMKARALAKKEKVELERLKIIRESLLPIPKNYPRQKPKPKLKKKSKICVVGVEEEENRENFCKRKKETREKLKEEIFNRPNPIISPDSLPINPTHSKPHLEEIPGPFYPTTELLTDQEQPRELEYEVPTRELQPAKKKQPEAAFVGHQPAQQANGHNLEDIHKQKAGIRALLRKRFTN